MDAIPLELKKAISVGIGLFIALHRPRTTAGSSSSGAGHAAVELGDFTSWPVLSTLFGLVAHDRAAWRVGFRGDLLIGIVATTRPRDDRQLGERLRRFTTPGVARLPDHVVEHPGLQLLGEFRFDSFAELGVSRPRS